MLGSVFGLVGDVAKIAVAPVALTADVARTVTKPVARETEELLNELRKALR
jgi:hypothetical protein